MSDSIWDWCLSLEQHKLLVPVINIKCGATLLIFIFVRSIPTTYPSDHFKWNMPDSHFLCQICSSIWRIVSALGLFPEKTEKLQKILYIKILSIRASTVTRTSMTTSGDLHGWPCWVWKFPYRATAGKGHWSLPWYSFFCTFWQLVILSWFHVASWSWKVLDIRTGRDARKGLGLCNYGKVIIHAGVMLFIVIAALGLPYFCK